MSQICTDSTFFTPVLALYSEDKRFNVLTNDTNEGSLITKLSFSTLTDALELLPMEQRIHAFRLYDETKLTVHVTGAIKLINLFPEEHKREVADVVLKMNPSILINSVHDTGALNTIIKVFDENEKFDLITQYNEYNNSVLSSLLRSNPVEFSNILNHIPANRKIEAIQKTDNDGKNLLCKYDHDSSAIDIIYGATNMTQTLNRLINKANVHGLNKLAIDDIKQLLILVMHSPNTDLPIDIDQSLDQLNAQFNQPRNKEEYLLKIDINLTIIKRKGQDLKRRSCNPEALCTTILYNSLLSNKHKFEQGHIDLDTFKSNAIIAIDDSRHGLQSHRGAKGLLAFLVQFTLFILGAGIFYLAIKYNYPGFFAIKTDSEKKLDVMQHSIAVAAF